MIFSPSEKQRTQSHFQVLENFEGLFKLWKLTQSSLQFGTKKEFLQEIYGKP